MSTLAKNCICIHIGQAGLQVANAAWELFTAEHGISADGKMKHGLPDDRSFETFFQETPSGQYVPRSLLVDLEPTVMDEIRTGPYKHLFHPDLMVNGMEDSGGNFARGRISIGQHMLPILAEKIRLIAESCDTVQGFFLFNSFGGGTGTGLGASLAEKLSHEFSRRVRVSVGVFPGRIFGTSCVEPYNSTFFSQSVIRDCDLSVLVDNDSLYQICANNLYNERPTFCSVNRIIAQVVSSLTCNLRFDGDLNGTLEEMRVNLIPYPTMVFPVASFAPILSNDRINHSTLTTEKLIRTVFHKDHRMMSVSFEDHSFMAACMYFRGDFSPNEINRSIQSIKAERDFEWVDWCPTGFKFGINRQLPLSIPQSHMDLHTRSTLLLANTGAMSMIFKRMKSHATLMVRKRAFFHWYEREGLEIDDLRNAIDDITVVEMDYREASKLTKDIPFSKSFSESAYQSSAREDRATVTHDRSPPLSHKPTSSSQSQALAKSYGATSDKSDGSDQARSTKLDVLERKPGEVSSDAHRSTPAQTQISEHHLIDGKIDLLCQFCIASLRTVPSIDLIVQTEKLPMYSICPHCLEGLAIMNSTELCPTCENERDNKFKTLMKYKGMRIRDLCKNDKKLFPYHNLRTIRDIRQVVANQFMRIEDICDTCKPLLDSDYEMVYVCGCISIDSLCPDCESSHKREIEVQARKAIVATDLCDRCKRQSHSVQPKLCKVWGAIETQHMCSRCIHNHEVDPDNDMIDPGSLCDNCRLKIDSTMPTAFPVKGSITSEKVCNDCKRRGRITSRDSSIDPSTLCDKCKLDVKNETPKLFQLKGSFDVQTLCIECQHVVSKKSKLNMDDICIDCKRRIGGKGNEITLRGHIDARSLCTSCLEKIKSRPDGGRGITIHIDHLCGDCKCHMRGRRDEINVRGGINPAFLCSNCEKKVIQPFSKELMNTLCDECLETIPKAGFLDERIMCGPCTKAVKGISAFSNNNFSKFIRSFRRSSRNSFLKKDYGMTNNNIKSKMLSRNGSSRVKWLNIGVDLGDTRQTTLKPVLRPIHKIIERLMRCKECTFQTGFSFKEGCIRGKPSDFCDSCLIKLRLPIEFLILCPTCRESNNDLGMFRAVNLDARPLCNRCINCTQVLNINFQTLQSIVEDTKANYGDHVFDQIETDTSSEKRSTKRRYRFFLRHNKFLCQANANNVTNRSRRPFISFFKKKSDLSLLGTLSYISSQSNGDT